MKSLFTTGTALLVILLSGCAALPTHEHENGSILVLDSPMEAHVFMNSASVANGETLDIFKNVCTTQLKKLARMSELTDVTTCKKVYKGDAEVVDNTNPKSIKVRTAQSTVFEQGDSLSKKTLKQ